MGIKCKFLAQNAGTITKGCLRLVIIPISTSGSRYRYGSGCTECQDPFRFSYGDTDFSYLMDNYLEDYFQWCADDPDFSSGYSLDSLGKHTFEYVNPIWMRELPD